MKLSTARGLRKFLWRCVFLCWLLFGWMTDYLQDILRSWIRDGISFLYWLGNDRVPKSYLSLLLANSSPSEADVVNGQDRNPRPPGCRPVLSQSLRDVPFHGRVLTHLLNMPHLSLPSAFVSGRRGCPCRRPCITMRCYSSGRCPCRSDVWSFLCSRTFVIATVLLVWMLCWLCQFVSLALFRTTQDMNFSDELLAGTTGILFIMRICSSRKLPIIAQPPVCCVCLGLYNLAGCVLVGTTPPCCTQTFARKC